METRTYTQEAASRALLLLYLAGSIASAWPVSSAARDDETALGAHETSTTISPTRLPIFREANREELKDQSKTKQAGSEHRDSHQEGSATEEFLSDAVRARLMKELRVIYNSESYEQGIIEVELENDNLREWNVNLHVFGEGELQEDLKKLKGMGGEDIIKLRLSFGVNYPAEPPFARVLYPVLHDGFVFPSGALCMNILTKDGWDTTFSTEAFILTILSALVEKPVRVKFVENLHELDGRYSELGARREFDAIKSVHDKCGW